MSQAASRALRPAPDGFGALDFLKVSGLGLILIAGQGAVAAWTGRDGLAPEWALSLTIYVALRSEEWVAALAALVLGLFRDAAGGGLLGVYAAAFIAAAWFFHPLSRRLRFDAAPLPLALLSLALFLGTGLLALTPLMALLGWPGEAFNPWPHFLRSALATAATAPPLFWALDRLTARHAGRGRHDE